MSSLGLTLKQTQKLSTQMLQSMHILQLNAQELESYIDNITNENPVLEIDDSHKDDSEIEKTIEKLTWLNTDVSYKESADIREADEDTPSDATRFKDKVDPEKNLYLYLQSQLSLLALSPEEKQAATYIVGCLNGSGYLCDSIENLLPPSGFTIFVLEKALRYVQGLEPAGVGARNLAECLMLQLERNPLANPLSKKIVAHHLDLVGRNNLSQLAHELKVGVHAVTTACNEIKKLNPKPGSAFTIGADSVYITPDVYIINNKGTLEIVENSILQPRLLVSSYYEKMLSTTASEDVKKYLINKVKQAKWLLNNIEQRNSTIKKCVELILQHQGDFFLQESHLLHPLTMQDLADELEINVSTVSRALKGKYLQSAQGVYPLTYFFSTNISKNANKYLEEAGVSSSQAKATIEKLIKSENKRKPLSDQKLSILLEQEGISISRRTIAKYREELGIPNTTQRKIH